jgi:hypothetical protein
MATITDAQVDVILALQFAVAWAGEGRSKPPRLGWWATDVVDEAGGGDFFVRLARKTHAWAALEVAREAARRADAAARKKTADADALRTPFFLGFEVDEALTDRLAALKREGRAPAEALALPVVLGATFSRPEVEKALAAVGSAAFTVVPGGRQLKGNPPDDPAEMVRKLVAALVPFTEAYPLPFYRVKT